ncbi:MAG: Fur family transcriptional regulator [Desulfotomaculaceae bacterium]|nr:Fur family transcriptional regulator [Desulfotomaculaceae bacterium]
MMINKIKKQGLRMTPQRMAILEFLEGNTSHPSAEEIYHQLKLKYPSLSLTTVYNNLELLTKAGELQEIIIRAEKRRFDPNPAPHGHFLCRICDSLFDLDAVTLKIRTPSKYNGYLVENFTIYYYGICPACLEGEANEKNTLQRQPKK